MQFNMATDYAIRSLLYLALVDRMAPASEVSERMNIPKQYLVTMSRRLKDAGLIGATSGAYGGYYLMRPAEEITLLDIVQVTEGTLKLNRCPEQEGCCSLLDRQSCPVHGVYENLRCVVDALLRATTLSDLSHGIRL